MTMSPCFRRPSVMLTAAVGLFLTCVAPAAVLGQSKSLPEAMFFPNRPEGLKSLEGKAPPELKLKTWIGDKVSVSESKGKVVVIDFWATWCGPCMAAIPKNVEIVKKYKDQGLVFIGVHDASSGWDQAAGVVKDKGINYPVAVDQDGGVSAKAFNLAFWPTYLVVDRAGIVRGAGLNPQKLEEVVKTLIAEPAPAGAAKKAADGMPAEWFYGGEKRAAALKAVEGKPMPALNTAQWLDKPIDAAQMKDRVVVLHFFGAGSKPSMAQAASLAELEKEMGPQGVMFIGVCQPEDAWDSMSVLAGEGKLPKRLAQDAGATDKQPAGTPGATAGAFGVRFVPCTVVIDRNGVVHAAGVRIDKVKEIAGKLLAAGTKAPEKAPTTGQ